MPTSLRDDIAKRLGDVGALSAKTESAERSILMRANENLGRVNKQIIALRPRITIDQNAGVQYLTLIKERAKLQMIVSRAQAHLLKS